MFNSIAHKELPQRGLMNTTQFCYQKSAFKAQNRLFFESILNNINQLTWSDPKTPKSAFKTQDRLLFRSIRNNINQLTWHDPKMPYYVKFKR